MRVEVQKVLFVGLQGERDRFFRRAQDAGLVQFIDHHDRPLPETPRSVQDIMAAIKVVMGLPVTEQVEGDDFAGAYAAAKKVLDCKHREEALLEERRMLRQEIARVEMFGKFSLEDIAFIESEGHRRIQFFCARKGLAEQVMEVEGLFYVGSEHGLDYFLSVQPETANYEGMIEMHVDSPLDVLQEEVFQVERRIKEIEVELKTFARYNDFLHGSLVYYLNAHNLDTAQDYVQRVVDENLYAVEGWVAISKGAELQQMLCEENVHCEEVAVEEGDRMPTCLDNEGFSRVGEDLVHIYDTPAITDKDPSPWVLWAFAVFFAMILSDGGYGVLFLGLGLYLRFKFPKARGLGKRMIRLTSLLAVSCIIWGVLTNSFFGLSFDVDSPVRKVSVLNWLAHKKAAYHLARQDDVFETWINKYPKLAVVSDPADWIRGAVSRADGKVKYEMLDEFCDNILLELALIVGMTHIILSLLRYVGRNWAAVGWVTFILGVYLYVPSYLNATSLLHFAVGLDGGDLAHQGYYLAVVGPGLAVVLSLMQNRLMGLLEISQMIQVFGDVLSYLRLYALGLAGGIVSATVNDMASSVGVVFGALLLIVGHTVNIVLSLMGGVIHGLRLNFIEWYHYSFDGGGKLFKPLKLMEID